MTVTLLLADLLASPVRAFATATPPVALGSVASFSVLGATGVTNTGATSVTGDVGDSPSSSVVGFPPGTVGGVIHAGDASAAQAQADLASAYNDAAGRTPKASFAGDLNGLTFDAGVYDSSAAVSLTGTVTLDGQGDPNAVFIFQVGAALSTAAASNVDLINGAQASNVFWQVVGAVGTGASSSFTGTIMAAGAITVGANAEIAGRVLSEGGTVTLSSNTVEFAKPPVVSITGGSTASTLDNTPTIAGTTDAAIGTTVTVTIAGQTLTTTVQSGGTWSVTATTVADGTYAVVVSITGPVQNTGTARQTLTVGKTTPVALGSVASFSVLGATGVTNTGATSVTGDVGDSPSSSVVGFPPGTVGGVIHAGDASAAQAQADLASAYNDAAGRTPKASFAGDLNGLTFDAGVYDSSAAVSLTGTVTLDGQGDPNAVFIFQVGAALSTAAASNVDLINGAQASNVFWQVVGAVGTGASSSFTGTIMAAGAITVGANAEIAGRVLSEGGTVTLSSNTVEFAKPPVVSITGGSTASTLDNTPTIAGTTDAAIGTTVTVTIAGQTLTTTVQSGGTWSVTATTVADGTYAVVVSITGPVQNTGTARQTLTVGKTTPVALGSVASFSVLGATGVTNTGATSVTGDVGDSPSSSVVGFPPGTVGGVIHAGDASAAQAQADLASAYNDAAGRTPKASFAGDLNGLTFDAGVYDSSAAVSLTGTVTLDGQGDPNAVFIFQVGAALSTAAASNVDLINGAQASNVFWQVVGAVGTGASSSFTGTIMAAGAITVGANAEITGRVLSDGTVTLSTNSIATPGPSGSTLAITVPAGPVDFGTYAHAAHAIAISGQLGTVEVNDTRDGSPGLGWVATVSSTPLTAPSAAAIPASSVSYSAGPIAQIRGAGTYTDDDPSDLTTAVPAVTATQIVGDNAEVTWDPTLTIIVPASAAAGTYSFTVTYSVS